MSQTVSQAKDELDCVQERETMQRRQQEAVLSALRDKQEQLENDCTYWQHRCQQLENLEKTCQKREEEAERRVEELENRVEQLKKSNLEKDAKINELISELQGKEQADLKTTMDFHRSAQLKEM